MILTCPGCRKKHANETHADVFCIRCYKRLAAEQKETYWNAVTKLWNAPPGRFGFFQRQLEMIVEDLATALAGATAKRAA